MLLTFSPDYSAGLPADRAHDVVRDVATLQSLRAVVAWTKRQERGQVQVRFTLPGASYAAHDDVIRALLTLDPGAEIRTAKAVYHGLADFERQYKASAEGS